MAVLKPAQDPYRTLGIQRGADLDQVKAAHRRLAKRFHPDGSSGDEQRFLAVQEAYQLLSDPARRRDWDRRHSPSPVHAADAGSPPSRRYGARDTRPGTASSRRGTAAPDARPGRAPGQRSTTGSADQAPWWEDFIPRAGGTRGSTDDGAAASSSIIDYDVFSRSSGAAWSMAARRHFRRGDADLPSRGAWRYRGTQVVTGAEARKVAAEEAAAQEAAARAAAAQAATAQAATAQAAGQAPPQMPGQAGEDDER